MAKARFGRVITAMITPFTEEGNVDYEGVVSLATYLAKHGSEGLLVAGTTGEGATMSDEEKLKLYRLICDTVKPNVSVIGNVGAIGTQDTIDFFEKSRKNGYRCCTGYRALLRKAKSRRDVSTFQGYCRVYNFTDYFI